MKDGLIIDNYGVQKWYSNDVLHREDDKPAIMGPNGDVEWWIHGKPHRVSGPAVQYTTGTSFWYIDGQVHRLNGPAIEWATGGQQWFLYGLELEIPCGFKTIEEWIKKLNNDENYSLQWINDINGLISFIKDPTGKQTRLHAMRWKI